MTPEDIPVFKRVTAALDRQSERHESAKQEAAMAMRRLEKTTVAAMVGWAKASAEVERLTGERDEARAALDRVRALHKRFETDDGRAYCDGCRDSLAGAARYPCDTIRALDGEGM